MGRGSISAQMMEKPNHALQPTTDRLEKLHMTTPTLKFAAQLAPVSGG